MQNEIGKYDNRVDVEFCVSRNPQNQGYSNFSCDGTPKKFKNFTEHYIYFSVLAIRHPIDTIDC